MENTRFAKLLELADQIEQYRFSNPSDDLEGFWGDQLAIKNLAKQVRKCRAWDK